MRDNSVLRTADGRAEVLLANGVTLRLGEQSSFRTIRGRLGDRVEILGGTAFLITTSVRKDPVVTIACEDVVSPSEAGVYRFDASNPWAAGDGLCRVKVYRGVVYPCLSTINVLLKSGETMNLQRECGDHIPTFSFNVNDADASNVNTGAFRSVWVPEKRVRR